MKWINLYRIGLILFMVTGLIMYLNSYYNGYTWLGILGLIVFIGIFANYLGLGVYTIVTGYLSRRAKGVE